MNENKTSCAPADNQLTSWDSIDWVKAELSVRKLQARIAVSYTHLTLPTTSRV